MIAHPAKAEFATGQRGETLELIVCRDYLWAGLYATPHSKTPLEVGVSIPHRVRAFPRAIQVGTERFSMAPKALQRATRWLDRAGVRVHQVRP
jgi:hypothetical protein